MPFLRRRPTLILTLFFFVIAGVGALAYSKKKQTTSTQMDESKRALHALQRLTFGPRPGEVQRMTAMGVDKWIDLQLHPDKIADSNLDGRLAPFRTLHMNTREMVENFPPQPLIKAVMEGRQPMPSDPVKRAVYQAQIDRLEEKRERKQETTSNPAPQPGANSTTEPSASDQPATPANSDASTAGQSSAKDEQQAKRREERLYADQKAQELLDLPPDERMKQVLKLPAEEQRAVSVSLRS